MPTPSFSASLPGKCMEGVGGCPVAIFCGNNEAEETKETQGGGIILLVGGGGLF